MKLTECLTEKTVEVGSTSKDPKAILSRLVDIVLSGGAFMAVPALLAQIEAREKLGSTGIGEGVAIPHVHVKGIKKLNVAMMTVPAGVEFDAIDGQPCSIFIIVVGPDEDREGYLKLLAEVARILRQPSVRKAVLAAKTPAELLKTLQAAEA